MRHLNSGDPNGSAGRHRGGINRENRGGVEVVDEDILRGLGYVKALRRGTQAPVQRSRGEIEVGDHSQLFIGHPDASVMKGDIGHWDTGVDRRQDSDDSDGDGGQRSPSPRLECFA